MLHFCRGFTASPLNEARLEDHVLHKEEWRLNASGVTSCGEGCFLFISTSLFFHPTCFQPALSIVLWAAHCNLLKGQPRKLQDSRRQLPTFLLYSPPTTQGTGQRVQKLANQSVPQNCELRDADTTDG